MAWVPDFDLPPNPHQMSPPGTMSSSTTRISEPLRKRPTRQNDIANTKLIFSFFNGSRRPTLSRRTKESLNQQRCLSMFHRTSRTLSHRSLIFLGTDFQRSSNWPGSVWKQRGDPPDFHAIPRNCRSPAQTSNCHVWILVDPWSPCVFTGTGGSRQRFSS